jgi:uracil-DNA glycosylase
VKAVILGQDPYPTPGHAHGLAFSVRDGVPPPRSLANILKELKSDLGHANPTSGSLEPWARQGVLLLNAVLTVRSGQAASHQNKGWERLTNAMIEAVAAQPQATVFCLWGNAAQAKEHLIPAGRHTILKAAHPSPLSAHRGFFGSRPFSQANAALRAAGRAGIDWRL